MATKGLYAAVKKALSGYVAIQRCQWHKRENVIAYLPKGERLLALKDKTAEIVMQQEFNILTEM